VESSSIAANPGHVLSRGKQASKEYQEHGSAAVMDGKENASIWVTLPGRQPQDGALVSKLSVRLNFLQALLAIILGNVVYFALLPTLPVAARHRPFRVDLGMVLDFSMCLVLYGLIRSVRKWR
jgi:hypothetical protein